MFLRISYSMHVLHGCFGLTGLMDPLEGVTCCVVLFRGNFCALLMCMVPGTQISIASSSGMCVWVPFCFSKEHVDAYHACMHAGQT